MIMMMKGRLVVLKLSFLSFLFRKFNFFCFVFWFCDKRIISFLRLCVDLILFSLFIFFLSCFWFVTLNKRPKESKLMGNICVFFLLLILVRPCLFVVWCSVLCSTTVLVCVYSKGMWEIVVFAFILSSDRVLLLFCWKNEWWNGEWCDLRQSRRTD